MGDLDTATLLTVTVPNFTSSFFAALIAANSGNGAPLRALALQLATDIDGAPFVDALWAITCNDAGGHPGPITAGALARTLDAKYPLIGAYSVTYTMGGCVAWPAPRQPVVDLHPKGTPPVIVIGNTGDPNTPVVNAQHLVTIFPHRQPGDVEGLGPHLVAQRFDRPVHAATGDHLSDRNGHRAPERCAAEPEPRRRYRARLTRSRQDRPPGTLGGGPGGQLHHLRIDRGAVDDGVAPLVEGDPLGSSSAQYP